MSTTTQTPSVYELLGREQKVMKLAAFLLKKWAGNAAADAPLDLSKAASMMSEKWWAHVAKQAGCKPPSRATIAAVVEFLRSTRP